MDADQLRDLWAEQAHEHYADDRQDAAEMYAEALRLLGDDSTTRWARDVIALRAAFYRDLLADIDRNDRPEGPPEMTETIRDFHHGQQVHVTGWGSVTFLVRGAPIVAGPLRGRVEVRTEDGAFSGYELPSNLTPARS